MFAIKKKNLTSHMLKKTFNVQIIRLSYVSICVVWLCDGANCSLYLSQPEMFSRGSMLILTTFDKHDIDGLEARLVLSTNSVHIQLIQATVHCVIIRKTELLEQRSVIMQCE